MKKTGPKILFYSILGLILMLSVTLVKNVIRTNQIREQIEAEKVKIAKIQAENDKLASEVANTQSAEFIEREMRNKLGLGKEGEAVVVLPDPDALRKLVPVVPVEVDTLPDPNWRKWVHLFTSK
jgi:cell division protein DivIC